MIDNERNHQQVLESFLLELNRNPTNPFVLKGGTALMMCFGLDRLSVDLDFDATGSARDIHKSRMYDAVDRFCNERGYSYRVGKDTDTVYRCFIRYQEENISPLKIEVSFRNVELDKSTIISINGILVYDLNTLTQMKAAAYLQRDKVRDLYDLTFMAEHHFKDFSKETIHFIKRAFEYKSLEQFDYMIRTQPDPYVDTDILETRFLLTFCKLGLLEPDSART